MPGRLDYDSIADVYDDRYHAGGPIGVAGALRHLVRSVGATRVAEIGCGTGHWVSQLQDHVWTCGLDLSMDMLRKAKGKMRKGTVVRADAHRLPLRRESLDLLYVVNALHHFADPAGFILDAARVLRDSGVLAIIGMDPQAGRDRWYLYDYFPGTLETDRKRYPATSQIGSWMTRARLSRIRERAVSTIRASCRGEAIFRDPILQKNGTSQLALLTDEAFGAGMRRIRSAVERNPATLFEMDVTLYLTTGQEE